MDVVKPYTLNIDNWHYWMIADSATAQHLPSTTADTAITLGTYTITIINHKENYITTLWSSEDQNQVCTISLYGNTTQDLTTVNWKFEQELKWYPWERF